MAVYTEVLDEELFAFLAGYDIGELLSYKGIAEGVENTNYYLHTTAGSYILTLYEKRVNESDLPFFLGLMQHLAAKGLNCPLPLKNRDGQTLGRLSGRPAAVFTFLDGIAVRRPTAQHCAALGSALAQLHLDGRDFPMTRPNSLSVSGWQPLFAQAESQADRVSGGLADRTRRELVALRRDWPANLPSGIIHADLFTDNVFFIGREVSGLIDFYFACTDAFAYDVAICLNAWCFEQDGSFNLTKGRNLLGGYQAVRPLDASEIDALPVLCRGSAMRFMLTRLVDWLNVPPGALVKPKDPLEYDRKLNFHRQARSASEYGLLK